MLLISAAVIGINSMLGIFSGNEFFRNEIASPLLDFCMFNFSVAVRKKLLNAFATVVSSLFISEDGIGSVVCIFPVSFFMMFHVVLILLLDFAMSLL